MTDANEQSIPSRGSHGLGIVERLRGWARADEAVWPSKLMGEAANVIERLRLTDDERDILSEAAAAALAYGNGYEAGVIQGILDRTK
jgi:hypothetical protein